MVGRVKTYEAIFKGQDIPKPGIPESFRVLIKEMQSLALDVRVLDENGEEVDLKQNFDEDEPKNEYAAEIESLTENDIESGDGVLAGELGAMFSDETDNGSTQVSETEDSSEYDD